MGDRANIKNARKTAHEAITQRFIDCLEKGEIPWHKPWTTSTTRPQNFTSKRTYNGLLNIMLLNMAGYSSPYWLTYKKCKAMGGNVRKGEKGSIVSFWTMFDSKTEFHRSGKAKQIPFLKYYSVFNVEQTDGISYPETEELAVNPDFNPIEEAELIVAGMPNAPELRHQEQRAYYRPSDDLVNMSKRDRFAQEPEYYSVLFHELTHSTMHETRCNRKSRHEVHKEYALEELVAEIGSSFLCHESGIYDRTIENSEGYIKSWIKSLKNDPKMIVKAASMAQKATKYIINEQEEAKQEEAENAQAVA